MCRLISGVAVLTGETVKVYTLPDSDSHSDIRSKFNIRDDDGAGNRQTPIEYIPVGPLDSFDEWKFLFDDERPDWWTDDMTDQAIRQLISAFRDRHENWKFKGLLDLGGTQITALPDGLSVDGWLNLSGTQITALPDGLSVGGWLNLSGTQITALPDGLSE